MNNTSITKINSTDYVKIPINLLSSNARNFTAFQMAQIINASVQPVTVPTTPAIKGRAAEVNYISAFKNTFCVRDTAKCGGKGDMIIWKADQPHIKILVEIKNYTNTVPSKELEKWNRDIDNTGCQGALFISNRAVCRSNITINKNAIILTTEDTTVAVAAADLLHRKLLVEMTHIFEDRFIKFNEQFVLISEYIEELNKLGAIILSLQTTVNKKCGELYKIYTETKHKINTAIDRVIMPQYKKEQVDRFAVPQIGFFAANNHIRAELEKALNTITYRNLTRAISEKKVEYIFDGKIIGINILKSKAHVYYKISDLNINYPLKYIVVKGNLLKIELTKQSYKNLILVNLANNLKNM